MGKKTTNITTESSGEQKAQKIKDAIEHIIAEKEEDDGDEKADCGRYRA